MFSSLSKAYDDLADQLEEINYLTLMLFIVLSLDSKKASKRKEEEKDYLQHLKKIHLSLTRLSKTHPLTARKIIYINRLFTSHIEGDDSEIQF